MSTSTQPLTTTTATSSTLSIQSNISTTTTATTPTTPTPDRYGFTGGVQYTPDDPTTPNQIHIKRELKWLHMFEHWNKYMTNNFPLIKSRCRKGIPRSVRGKAWSYLCGGIYLQQKYPTVYSELELREGPPEAVEDIKKDIYRQFPNHELFNNNNSSNNSGPNDLFQVLKCFSIYNGKEGYCQAHAPIAATLLMQMPAEDAFWCLVCICDKYVKGYYSPGMESLMLDGVILFKLLRHVDYKSYKLLKKYDVEPVLYMTEWFLCIFTRTLPWPSVLRVWDMFLCEGVKVLFKVGLVLLKGVLGGKAGSKCGNMYDVLSLLKGIGNGDFNNGLAGERVLVNLVVKLDVNEELMRRVHLGELMIRKKQKDKEKALASAASN